MKRRRTCGLGRGDGSGDEGGSNTETHQGMGMGEQKNGVHTQPVAASGSPWGSIDRSSGVCVWAETGVAYWMMINESRGRV